MLKKGISWSEWEYLPEQHLQQCEPSWGILGQSSSEIFPEAASLGLSQIRGCKGVKKMEHAGRISKRQDNERKCKTFSHVLSSKQPAGFLIIPSLQWLLEKKVTCCIVTSVNKCSYLSYIGMMIKSYFNKLVLDGYLDVNFSEYWESWVQNPHGKDSRFHLGGRGCLAKRWLKKSLFDSDT